MNRSPRGTEGVHARCRILAGRSLSEVSVHWEASVHGNRVLSSCLVVGAIVTGGMHAHQSVGERGLDPAIGPANAAKYESILDAQEWLNPYLSVCLDRIVLSVRSVNRVDETVPLGTLRNVLLDLPVTAWPYGRVVGLQDCSLGSRDDVEARKTMLGVDEILDALRVEKDRWPS